MIRNKLFLMLLFLGICSIARGQTSQYWFDSNYGGAVSKSVSNGTIDVDLTGLEPGVHTLHYLYNNRGVPSSTYSKAFLVPNPQIKGSRAEYWFDQDYSSHVTTTNVGNITVDASSLTPGVHTLNYHQIYISEGVFTLQDGQLRPVPNNNQTPSTKAGDLVSSTYAYPFLVPEPTAIATKGEYWFDSNYDGRKQLALSAQAVPLDLSGLTPGLHSVRYHALSANGLPSTTYTGFFWIGAPTSKVKAYHYWVNELTDQIKTVLLETPVANYNLTTQIEVPQVPVRTEKYHFETQNGQSKIYAKNTLSMVFENVDGTSVRIEQDYVDYRVSGDIDAVLLEPGDQKTVDKSDGIMWFKVVAEKGDMLSFKTNRRCTMHLFSSSNEELWTASGDKVLLLNGTKADVDGTFYLAVQDLTDTNAKNITVEYTWNPKGDANGDKEINDQDRTVISNHIIGKKDPEGYNDKAADINNDGLVNVADIVELNNMIKQ